MAYRGLGMVEPREIVRRWQGGNGVRAIARGTGMDRKTIAEYLRALQAVGVQPGGPPPTDEQLTAITTVRRPGRPSNADAPSPEVDALWPHAAQIRAWLTEGLRLTKIYRRLRGQGLPVSYSSLYRFVLPILSLAPLHLASTLRAHLGARWYAPASSRLAIAGSA
jgi:hypothetical protein